MAESEAVERFAADVSEAVDDAERRGADPRLMEVVLQDIAQDIRERSNDADS